MEGQTLRRKGLYRPTTPNSLLDAECSSISQGVCVQGRCACTENWEGEACEKYVEPTLPDTLTTTISVTFGIKDIDRSKQFDADKIIYDMDFDPTLPATQQGILAHCASWCKEDSLNQPSSDWWSYVPPFLASGVRIKKDTLGKTWNC